MRVPNTEHIELRNGKELDVGSGRPKTESARIFRGQIEFGKLLLWPDFEEVAGTEFFVETKR